nr:MAG: polyprotein [Wufeng shrew iflavirus 12]
MGVVLSLASEENRPLGRKFAAFLFFMQTPIRNYYKAIQQVYSKLQNMEVHKITSYPRILLDFEDNRMMLNSEFNKISQSKEIMDYLGITIPQVAERRMKDGLWRVCVFSMCYGEEIKVYGTGDLKVEAKTEAIRKYFARLVSKWSEKNMLNENKVESKVGRPSVMKTDDHILEDWNRVFQHQEERNRYNISAITSIITGRTEYMKVMETTIEYLQNGSMYSVTGRADSRRKSKVEAVRKFFAIQKELGLPKQFVEGRMEEPTTIAGDTNVEVDVQKETVISEDTLVEETITKPENPEAIREAAAATMVSKFEDWSMRWFRVAQYQLPVSQPVTNGPWKILDVPGDLIAAALNIPNITPFRQYSLFSGNIWLRFKVNSGRFNQGRLVMSYLLQGRQMQVGNLSTPSSIADSYMTLQNAIQRDHVFMDLNEANTADLKIPFINKYAFVKIGEDSTSDADQHAVATIHVISPLLAPDEAPQYVNLTVLARFENATFTALRPAISDCPPARNAISRTFVEGRAGIVGSLIGGLAQMPIVGDLIQGGIGAISNMVSPVLGMLNPQRKDGVENDFGKGILSSFLNLDKPANHRQPSELRPNALGDMAIAVRSEPKFSMRLDSTALTPSMNNHFPGKTPTSVHELCRVWSFAARYDWTVTQNSAGQIIATIPTDISDVWFRGTILGYFREMYGAYAGSLEFRLDIVGTPYHNGAFSMGFVPFVNEPTHDEARAALYKWCDVQTNRQFIMEVPYVDVQILRTTGSAGASFPAPEYGNLRLFVENALVPIGSVAQKVEILVFVRAAPDFHFTNLYTPNVKFLTRHQRIIEGRMDTGDKETFDTATFYPLSRHGVEINIGEDQEIISDIWKRWSYSQTITNITSRKFGLFEPWGINSAQAMLSRCFRYKRGGECLCLVFSPYVAPTEARSSLLVNSNTINYRVGAPLPTPLALGGYTPTDLVTSDMSGEVSYTEISPVVIGDVNTHGNANHVPVMNTLSNMTKENVGVSYLTSRSQDLEIIHTVPPGPPQPDVWVEYWRTPGNREILRNGNLNSISENSERLRTRQHTNCDEVNLNSNTITNNFNNMRGSTNAAITVLDNNRAQNSLNGQFRNGIRNLEEAAHNTITVANKNVNQANTNVQVYNNDMGLVRARTNANMNGIAGAIDRNTGLNPFNLAVQARMDEVLEQTTNMAGELNDNVGIVNNNNGIIESSLGTLNNEVKAIAADSAIIKVSFIPPSSLNTSAMMESFGGMPTQILFTEINRSMKVYIPYYLMTNYQDWLNTSAKPREMISSTLGTIQIESSTPVNCDIYFTFADDAYMTQFIGVPTLDYGTTEGRMDVEEEIGHLLGGDHRNRRQQRIIIDQQVPSTSADAQYLNNMDNQSLPTTKLFSDFTKNTRDRVYDSFTSVYNKITYPFSIVKETTNRLDRLATMGEKMVEATQSITSYIQDAATNIVITLKDKFAWIKDTGNLFSAVLHMLHCYISPTLSTVVLSILGVITNLGLIGSKWVSDIGKFFIDHFTKWRVPLEQSTGTSFVEGRCDHDCGKCKGNCDELCAYCNSLRPLFDANSLSILGGLIMGSVSAFLGVKSLPVDTGLCKGLFKIIPSFWTSISHSVRFLKDLITLCMRCFQKLGKKDVLYSEASFVFENPDELKEFIKEAQICMNYINKNSITTIPSMKHRFWLCVVKAYSIQEKLITRSQPETRALLQLCDRLIKYSNDIVINSRNCPVRYEPFVLALSGDTKVGKSYLLNTTLSRLLADEGDKDAEGNLISDPGLGVTTWGQAVYTRTAGVEFWNGYTDQPAILYDDFLASTDPQLCARQVIEMYNLKSSAPMNCNMASIEDKDLFANPFLVATASNSPFVVPNGITCSQAFLRRRDMLWEVRLKTTKKYSTITDYINDPEYPRRYLKSFKHLVFYRYQDVSNSRSLDGTQYTYDEFLYAVKQEIRRYHKKEQQNVLHRFEQMKLTLPKEARTMLMNTDPFYIFYKSLVQSSENSPTQTGLLPSELFMVPADDVLGMVESQAVEGRMFSKITSKIREKLLVERFKYRGWKRDLLDYFLGVRPLVYGDCYICLRNNVVIGRQCIESPMHGMCVECTQAAEDGGHNQSTCGLCRDGQLLTPYGSAGSIRFMLIRFRRWRQNVSDRVREALEMGYNFALGPIGLSTIMIYLYAVIISYGMASQQYSDEKFFSALFDIPFDGRIETKWGLSQFIEGRMDYDSSESLEISTTRIYPDVRVDRLPDIRVWDRKIGEHSLVPTVQGICTHMNIDCENIKDYDYVWNQSMKRGYWIDTYDNVVNDNPCMESCRYTLSFRKTLINSWIEERGPSIRSQLRNIESNGIMHEIYVPMDLISPEFITARDEVVERMLAVIEGGRTKTLYDRLSGLWKDYARYIALALSAVGMITGLISVLQFFRRGANEEEVEERSSYYEHANPKKISRIIKPKSTIVGRGGKDTDLLMKRIPRNTIFIDFKCERMEGEELRTDTTCARGLGLFGRTAIFTKHEIQYVIYNSEKSRLAGLKSEAKVRCFSNYWSDSPIVVDLPIEKFTFKFTDTDICYVELPVRFPQFKDITSLIMTAKAHSVQYKNMTMMMLSKTSPIVSMTEVPILARTNVTIQATQNYGEIPAWDVYQMNYGEKGSCGTIGIIEASSPIACFYHSGIKGEKIGYAIPLIREDVEVMKQGKAVYDVWIPKLVQGMGKVQIDGDVIRLGCVGKKQIPYLPEKSKIIPSLIQGKIPFSSDTKTQPAILSARDSRWTHDHSPLYHGIKKHGNLPRALPPIQLAIAVNSYQSHLLEKCRPIRELTGLLTLKQAIAGIDELEFYDPINLATSTGWPLNTGSDKVKSEYITILRDKHSIVTEVDIADEVLEVINMKQESRQRGIRPFTVFQDTLKDERRSQRKLDKPDGTRVFSQCPLDYLITFRQYFLDFMAAYMKHRHLLSHAIGITTNGPEWALLVERLHRVGSNIFSGDFTDYGPRIWPELVSYCGIVINAWYARYSKDLNENEHAKIRTMLIEEITNTYHIAKDVIYMTFCGIPSGHPATTIMNDMIHQILIRLAWNEITKAGFEEFEQNVQYVTYGDDELVSVSNKYKDIFNCVSLAEWYSKYEFKYTDASKVGNIKYTTIDKVSFLKCGFKPHPTRLNQWLAPLEDQSVTESAKWVFTGPDIGVATSINADQSVRLMFGHGKDRYEGWQTCVNSGLTSVRLPAHTVTWEEIDENFFGDVPRIFPGESIPIMSTTKGEDKNIHRIIPPLMLQEDSEDEWETIHTKVVNMRKRPNLQ